MPDYVYVIAICVAGIAAMVAFTYPIYLRGRDYDETDDIDFEDDDHAG